MKKILILVVALTFVVAGIALAGVTNTKHDLSASSTSGGYKTTGATEICVFCHTPHQATGAPAALLWNRTLGSSTTNFGSYTSATMNSTPTTLANDIATQNSQSSVLCMSCHDGTVALAALLNQPNTGSASSSADSAGHVVNDMVVGNALIGPTLNNDHPINFTYDAALATSDGGLNGTITNGKVAGMYPLFGSTMQCATCHSVHDNANSPFLRSTNAASQMCINCHTNK